MGAQLCYNYTLMSDLIQQIADIEKEIRETPYHKGTERHIGILRARLSKLKDPAFTKTAAGGGGGGYAVKKQGDATVVLIGPPSAGKSTLINKLTNAESKVAPYAFTTVSVIPGMLKYREAYIQILDVPGLIQGAQKGKGRGKEVLSVARGADLLLIMSDPKRFEALANISEELEEAGIRINKNPPLLKIDKKLAGGIIIHSNIKQDLALETVKEVALEFGIKNAEINIKEYLTMENLIDAFAKNRVYIPGIFVVNKIDTAKNPKTIKCDLGISAETGQGMDELKNLIWDKLELSLVYLIKPLEEPNFNNPMVVKRGMSLKELTEKIGTDFAANTTGAKIWGNGAKFSGQEVSLQAKTVDGMQVRFM